MKCILILTAALFLPGCAMMDEAFERRVHAQARFYARERAETNRRWEASLERRGIRLNRRAPAPSADPVVRAIREQTRVLKQINDQQFLEWVTR